MVYVAVTLMVIRDAWRILAPNSSTNIQNFVIWSLTSLLFEVPLSWKMFNPCWYLLSGLYLPFSFPCLHLILKAKWLFMLSMRRQDLITIWKAYGQQRCLQKVDLIRLVWNRCILKNFNENCITIDLFHIKVIRVYEEHLKKESYKAMLVTLLF